MSDGYFYLYKITNNVNKKVYIGQTINPKARWSRHRSDARSQEKIKRDRHLCCAIRKYGVENFIFEVIAQAKCLEDIDEVEIACIKQYNSSDRNFGYNISYGGNGKRMVSENTKKKLSLLNLGKKASDETKIKMSSSMLGKNSGQENGMYGRTPKHAKLTLQQAKEIRFLHQESKSMTKLAKMFNVSKKTILNIIHNKIYRDSP
jgi:group I intron endonuclease